MTKKNDSSNDLGASKSTHTITQVVRQSMEAAYRLQQQGKMKEAAALYNKVLTIDPMHVNANHLLALCHFREGKYELGIPLLRRALTVKKDFKEAHNNMGLALSNLGLSKEAINSFENAIAIDKEYAEPYHNLALAYKKEGDLSKAEELLITATNLKPDYAMAFNSLGLIYQELGDKGKLVASLEKAIKINPTYAIAYRHLAGAIKFSELNSSLLKQMEDLFQSQRLPAQEAKHLAFALGKAYEDLNIYDKSFHYYAMANALHRRSFNFNSEGEKGFFTKIQKVFDKKWLNEFSLLSSDLNTDSRGKNTITPIFILGMPRSGSSLVEQILASHSSVHGGGELNVLQNAVLGYAKQKGENFPEAFSSINSNELDKLAEVYLDQLRSLNSEDKPYITDKLPHNFVYLGIILAALPNAKIIHIRREPMDTCFSIFKHYFQEHHHYGYDLREIGLHYRSYESLMTHWEEQAATKILDLQYESIVEAPDTQIERILDHCGLGFEQACKDFHLSNRPVETASALQVRQPLYSSGVRSWTRYKDHLKPLHDVLSGRLVI